ncbi:unnamed protein product [Caretta caretta]
MGRNFQGEEAVEGQSLALLSLWWIDACSCTIKLFQKQFGSSNPEKMSSLKRKANCSTAESKLIMKMIIKYSADSRPVALDNELQIVEPDTIFSYAVNLCNKFVALDMSGMGERIEVY